MADPELAGLVRMAQAHLQGRDFAQARDTCQEGLRRFPGNTELAEVLAEAMASVNQQYRVEKPVLLTPSLDPLVAGGTDLAAGTLIEVSDVVVFKGVTRMKARTDGASGWLDFRSGEGCNVGKHPHGPRDPVLSAREAVQDCVMAGSLDKKGSLIWRQRFFVIGPRRLSPSQPDRFLYYYENETASRPKDTMRIETCRASACQEKAHSLHIAVGQRREGKPDHYLVAAPSAAECNAWRSLLDKMIAGESTVPAVFQRPDEAAPPPAVDQLEEMQPEPEEVAVPPVVPDARAG
eukprot:COSAG02_NODE_6255_length_3695_cov_16.449291_2_plen_292_part_00